jgi:hypothetical protein
MVKNLAQKTRKQVEEYNNNEENEITMKYKNTTLQERREAIGELLKIKEKDGYRTHFTVYFKAGGKRYFFLNDNIVTNFTLIKNGADLVLDMELKSDPVCNVISDARIIEKVKISRREILNVNSNGDGEFFKFILKDEKINLERYQIYNKNNYKQKISETNKENCFLYALSLTGINDLILSDLKTKFRGGKITVRNIKKICDDYNLNVEVYKPLSKDKLKELEKQNKKVKNTYKKTSYGPKSENPIKIGLIEEHFFLIEQTKYTAFSISNFEEVKNEPKFNEIYKKRDGIFRRDPKRTIDSFKLVNLLMEHKTKLLEEMSFDYETLGSLYSSELNIEKINLEYDPSKCTKTIEYTEKLPLSNIKVFFDFETRTDGVHRAYLVCYSVTLDDKIIYTNHKTGVYCAREFLEDVYDFLMKKKKEELNVIFLAHNINYDIKFIIEYLYQIKLCYRGENSICGGYGKYKPPGKMVSMIINVRDTYALIPERLCKFADMFGLEKSEKEVMPYEVYNCNQAFEEKPLYEIKKALNFLKFEAEKTQFMTNLKKMDLIVGDKFKMLDYALFYCAQDVNILINGYNKFKKSIQEDFEMNIDAYLTISSFADDYLKKRGCYDGCYAISGIPRFFIQGATSGGRTMTRDNKKYHIKALIQALDGVSLYPSAMKRMAGFLRGIPKVFTPEEIKNLNNRSLDKNKYDGLFLEIKITKINKNYKFPLISEKNEDGIRYYTNKLPLSTIKVDKIMLEDLEVFHNIQYQVIRGYYFNDGHNNTINNVIEEIFNKRVELKRQKNNKQQIYKLFMNSAYGKTLLKENIHEKIFFDSKQSMFKYCHKHYNHIDEVTKFHTLNRSTKKYVVKINKTFNNHFNSVHIGSEILSTSKRIMNEVMCLAEDLGIKIYYQDTDSMHIEDPKIDLLATEYKKKYDRELLGKSLGQFHCDFEPREGATEEEHAVSIESYYLGKKVYCEIIQYTDTKGNINYGIHYRMKGIPQNVILNHYNDIKRIYTELYDGKIIKFNLLSCGIKFKNNNNFCVTTVDTFEREVSF